MPREGQVVGGRYRLEEKIASGGMGDVWRAVDETLGRCVAVKTLHSRLVTDAEFGERFRREARAMAALRHPGVAQVYDYGEVSLPGEPALAYIVMECVQGQPLAARIAEARRLDPAETMSIAAQTARALDATHRAGVVHRDVKPNNLIIEPDGHVVLVDFGVAVTQEAVSLTAANKVVGTPLYMAPEQVARNETTPAIDIYALGAVTYHCLAGRPPYQGDNAVTVALRHLEDEPPPLPEDVPAELRQFVATAMAKEPADRFPTAAAMASAAQALADSYARPGSPTVRAAWTEPPTVALTPRQPAASGTPRRLVGREPTKVAVLLGSLAAAAAVLTLADPAGTMSDRTGRPSDPPAVSPTVSPSTRPAQVEPGPGAGGGEPVARTSAGMPTRTPGSPSPTATRPADGSTTGATPTGGSSSPDHTTSGSASAEPTGAPTGGTTGGPTVEPTDDPSADPTGEPTEEPTEEPSADESTAGDDAASLRQPTPDGS
ncbi:serine/threonine-protein kinase [Micromonospora globbae]|uniref:serine/threonine-protein kinase n=1 Tax=Micromonospora globbae TaxID=1894969 RepID=UPI003870C5DA|nr:serine/threonine protein kinase [Micromonospora globbae]